METHSWRQGPTRGCAPPWAPASGIQRSGAAWGPWVLACYMETGSSAPQVPRELLPEGGDSETHTCTFQRGWRTVWGTSLRTGKEMGNFWAWFWLTIFFFSKRSSGSHGSEGLSEQERSQHQSPRLDPVSKNLFPSTQVIESCIRAPMAEAQFTVTIRELVCQTRLYMKWLCCFLSDCTGVLWGWTLYLTG